MILPRKMDQKKGAGNDLCGAFSPVREGNPIESLFLSCKYPVLRLGRGILCYGEWMRRGVMTWIMHQESCLIGQRKKGFIPGVPASREGRLKRRIKRSGSLNNSVLT